MSPASAAWLPGTKAPKNNENHLLLWSASLRGCPSTFQTITCYCCKWGNWGLNKLNSFLRDTWLITQRFQSTCFSHFQSFPKKAIYNPQSEAKTKFWSFFLWSMSLPLITLPTPPAHLLLSKGLQALSPPSSYTHASPGGICAPEKQGQKGH